MSINLRTKSALVCDNGLFCDLAPRLAREFGQVLYFMPWTSAYPKAAPAAVGTGIRGVERVPTLWDRVPDVDLVVFPDLYFADAAAVCRDRFHKPVWAHLGAEVLELDRWGTRRLQKRLGIGSPRTQHIIGTDSLERYLRDPANEDKWVKTSTYRGDGETWHHETWHTSSVYLDHFRNRVGALAAQYEFIVEDAVNDAIEVGYDGFCVRGEWPDASYWGFEVKDAAYVGKFSPYSELPEPIRAINSKMGGILKEESAAGFCSFEFRLEQGGDPIMIDPCLRCGSPPIEGVMEGYANLGEIVWEGAQGRLAPVKSAGGYVAIAMMHSDFALTNWVPLDIPDDIAQWVKLRNRAVVGGKTYHVPTLGEMPEIGAVVAVADSLEEAMALVVERADRVCGYKVEVCVEALDCAEEEIEQAREYGIEF